MEFFEIKTTDFTTNSRFLLRDMITTSIKNGLQVFTNNELLEIENLNGSIIAKCSNDSFQAKHMAICIGAGIEKFSNFNIKKTYAPIAVVKNRPDGKAYGETWKLEFKIHPQFKKHFYQLLC